MNIKRITAIVPIESLAMLENYLREYGVPGVTVENVQGYGEHPNFFRKDMMHDNARIVLYAAANRVNRIVAALSRSTQNFGTDSGIATIEDIDRLINLTTGVDIEAESL